MSIAQNLADVRKRIAAAARRAGRDPAEVRLVAVSKTIPAERLLEAMAAGHNLFGENYLQEAQPKIAALGDGAHWHFVGHLQTKKAKGVVGLFELIHSVDRIKLAQALDQAAAARRGLIQDILIQVNLAGEASKSGMAPGDVADLLKEIGNLPRLRVTGLMTMPPWFDEPERVRPYFQALRELRDSLAEIAPSGSGLTELSMGMTGDFEVAVEEGATLVRIGAAIFGERPNH